MEKPKIRVSHEWKQIRNETTADLKKARLHTICAEGACPNIAECWSKKHAAFMVMGDVCTRRCTFCHVKKGRPTELDIEEPENLADTVQSMGLRHVVVTSVTRDDLRDGGAGHFAEIVRAIRRKNPNTTIELLTPDFRRKGGALEKVLEAKPDVFNHNVETVPRLYPTVRLGSNFFDSLALLKDAKRIMPEVFTKSGIMLGLGETEEEILEVMDYMRDHNIDFMTIGQYLRPTKMHHEVVEYVTVEKFDYYKQKALEKGFLMVSSSPLTRSSYHADEDFEILRKQRDELLRSNSQ